MTYTYSKLMERRGRENRVDSIILMDITSYPTGGIDISSVLESIMPSEQYLMSAVSQEGEGRFLTINSGVLKSWDMDDGAESANEDDIKEWLLHVVGY